MTAMVQMLSPERCRVVKDAGFGTERSFGFQFAAVKTVLARLRETQGTICFMSIVPKGQTRFHLFLRSPEKHEEFSVISADKLPNDQSLIAFEAVVQGNSREDAERAFIDHGFSTLMLAQAAHALPFGAGRALPKTMAEVEMPPEVLQVVESVPDVGIGLLELDHVFFATKEEVVKMRGEQVL